MNRRVYVAGPMTLGPIDDNIRTAIEAGTDLMRAGYFPFIPHLTHFWAMMWQGNDLPTHEEWLAYDKEWVTTSGALIRLPGKSSGADQEVRWARRHGIPTYKTVQEFLDVQDARD